MSFISKVELKQQLRDMGIKVKGNYIRKKDLDMLLADVVPFAENSEDRDFYKYYENPKKPPQQLKTLKYKWNKAPAAFWGLPYFHNFEYKHLLRSLGDYQHTCYVLHSTSKIKSLLEWDRKYDEIATKLKAANLPLDGKGPEYVKIFEEVLNFPKGKLVDYYQESEEDSEQKDTVLPSHKPFDVLKGQRPSHYQTPKLKRQQQKELLHLIKSIISNIYKNAK